MIRNGMKILDGDMELYTHVNHIRVEPEYAALPFRPCRHDGLEFFIDAGDFGYADGADILCLEDHPDILARLHDFTGKYDDALFTDPDGTFNQYKIQDPKEMSALLHDLLDIVLDFQKATGYRHKIILCYDTYDTARCADKVHSVTRIEAAWNSPPEEVTRIWINPGCHIFPVMPFNELNIMTDYRELPEFIAHPELMQAFRRLQDEYENRPWDDRLKRRAFKTTEESDAFLKKARRLTDSFSSLAQGRYFISPDYPFINTPERI